jgi:hypothetical protein
MMRDVNGCVMYIYEMNVLCFCVALIAHCHFVLILKLSC